MSVERFRESHAAAVSVCLFLFTLACGREPGIIVNIAPWPDGVEHVRVHTTIDSVVGTDIFLNKDQSRVAVRLPVDSYGTVQIDALGLDAMGCQVATDRLIEQVPDNLSRFVERTLALSSLPSQICPFSEVMNFQVGASFNFVAVGNFESGTNTDLAITASTPTDGKVYLLHGLGTGRFDMDLAKDVYDVNKEKSIGMVAVGDFNGDMKPDLVVTNFAKNSVSVLLGDGIGGFSKSDPVAVGGHPISVAVGDFDGDRNLDLAVTNQDSDYVSVLLGDGMGGFLAAPNQDVGSNPASLAVGDFNGDKKLDLAVICAGDADDCMAPNVMTPNVKLLLGNGAGRFDSVCIPLKRLCTSVVVGDFNGDMKPDLALACTDGKPDPEYNEVLVLLGDGVGGFDLPSISSVGKNPSSVAVGDFNGDMKPDLAVVNYSAVDLSILLNKFSLTGPPR